MTDKLKIGNLVNAVDNDTEGSRIRDAAMLLITSMNDWPTFNQTSLNEFIKEFKYNFGDNFNIDTLQQQTAIDNWKNESKESVVEMLKLFPTREFNDIVEIILTKYFKE
jgi:hypothetical protein